MRLKWEAKQQPSSWYRLPVGNGYLFIGICQVYANLWTAQYRFNRPNIIGTNLRNLLFLRFHPHLDVGNLWEGFVREQGDVRPELAVFQVQGLTELSIIRPELLDLPIPLAHDRVSEIKIKCDCSMRNDYQLSLRQHSLFGLKFLIIMMKVTTCITTG